MPNNSHVVLKERTCPQYKVRSRKVILHVYITINKQHIRNRPFRPPMKRKAQHVSTLRRVRTIVNQQVMFITNQRSRHLRRILLPRSSSSTFLRTAIRPFRSVNHLTLHHSLTTYQYISTTRFQRSRHHRFRLNHLKGIVKLQFSSINKKRRRVQPVPLTIRTKRYRLTLHPSRKRPTITILIPPMIPNPLSTISFINCLKVKSRAGHQQ